MIPKTSNKFATVCCCLPLALCCLISAVAFLLWGAYDILLAVQSDNFPSWGPIIVLILACLKALMGLLGLASVLFCWPKGAGFLIASYNILFMSVLISFIVQWIAWIVVWVDKEDPFPTSDDVPYMVIFNILYVLFFIFSWWICSAFKSFAAVLGAGGSGWENKNYVTIRADKVLADQQQPGGRRYEDA